MHESLLSWQPPPPTWPPTWPPPPPWQPPPPPPPEPPANPDMEELDSMWLACHVTLGKQVKIHGLQATPQLNGQVGLAESYNNATGRYNVKLSNGDVKAFHPKNLAVRRGVFPAHVDTQYECICIHVNIYIYRERERDVYTWMDTYVCI